MGSRSVSKLKRLACAISIGRVPLRVKLQAPAAGAQVPAILLGTSDCHGDATPPYHEAVIALEAGSGKPRWAFRPRGTDPFCGFDFGATPNIIGFGNGRFLGIGGKDGTYNLLNRLTQKPAGELVWHTNVVFGGLLGGFYGGAAFDGAHIFSATGIGDIDPLHPTKRCTSDPRDLPFQEPSMHALHA